MQSLGFRKLSKLKNDQNLKKKMKERDELVK